MRTSRPELSKRQIPAFVPSVGFDSARQATSSNRIELWQRQLSRLARDSERPCKLAGLPTG